jgi:hypothetical protein
MKDMRAMGAILHRIPIFPLPDSLSADIVLLGKSPFGEGGLPEFLPDSRRGTCSFMKINIHAVPLWFITYRASLGDRFFSVRLRASACPKRTGMIMASTLLGACAWHGIKHNFFSEYNHSGLYI